MIVEEGWRYRGKGAKKNYKKKKKKKERNNNQDLQKEQINKRRER